MAYNKDNYEHNRLTPKQEKFVDRNTRAEKHNTKHI